MGTLSINKVPFLTCHYSHYLEKYGEAAKCYTQAIKENPKKVQYLTNRASAYYMLGHYP